MQFEKDRGKDNIRKEDRGKKRGGSQILGWTYARGGGGHSDAYCVQQGGWGGSKNPEKMRT